MGTAAGIRATAADRCIIYVGVGLILIGYAMVYEDFIDSEISPVLSLAVFIIAMGLVLSFVGLGAKDRGRLNEANGQLKDRHSLGHLGAEVERHFEREKNSSGNRALGFVLTSMGIFILAVPGLLGLINYLINGLPLADFGIGYVTYLTSSIGLFGIACLTSGVFLHGTSF